MSERRRRQGLGAFVVPQLDDGDRAGHLVGMGSLVAFSGLLGASIGTPSGSGCHVYPRSPADKRSGDAGVGIDWLNARLVQA